MQISRGISRTLEFKKAASVINCDYNEKIGPTEKILVIFKMFPNSHLGLIKSFSSMPTQKHEIQKLQG
jgi:hypothetical protein